MPALLPTQAQQFDSEHHVYRDGARRLPGATDIIKAEGLIDTSWMSEAARYRGRVVHEGIKLINKGTIDWDSVNDELAGYLRSYQKFLKVSGFKVMGFEEPLFCDGFGCIPDTWGMLNDVCVVVECKSGPVPKWAAIQTALQARALRMTRGLPITKRFGLQLRADGEISKLQAFESDMDEIVAMGWVRGFEWRARNGYIKNWGA